MASKNGEKNIHLGILGLHALTLLLRTKELISEMFSECHNILEQIIKRNHFQAVIHKSDTVEECDKEP